MRAGVMMKFYRARRAGSNQRVNASSVVQPLHQRLHHEVVLGQFHLQRELELKFSDRLRN